MSFNGKILLVDDEPHVRKFVSLILRGLGSPTVIEASSGQEAVERFAAESPDMVLLDVNMPQMDGVETLRAIMAEHPEALVIMLTSLANRQTIEQCLAAGAAGYVRKDTPKEEILAEISAILEEGANPS